MSRFIAHELSHAAAGFKHGHKGDFAKLMQSLGMIRPMTSSTAGDQFKAWAQPFLDQLGNIPHAKIILQPDRTAIDGGSDDGEGGDEGGSSNAKKKQTTRMLKATCEYDGCGYTVRLSKKWAVKLGACCPLHGVIEVDGAEPEPDSDE
jgi:hypothetical protein